MFRRLFSKPVAAPAPVERIEPVVMKIKQSVLARSRGNVKAADRVQIGPYTPPPGVIPESKREAALAMDSTDYAYVNSVWQTEHFRGYPYLAIQAQKPEYRKMSETIAREMTRKWIKLICTNDDGQDKSDRIRALEDAMERYEVQSRFREVAEMDGFYGRGQLYLDVKTPSGVPAREDDAEMQTPLLIDKAKITKGSLIAINSIEPVWTYPGQFNAEHPLRADFYRPTQWFVLGKIVHHTRLLTFVSREVPDLLKAAYNFGGLSLSQMAEPYVDNWLRTRDSVGDMIHSFSISGIKTNLQATLTGGGDDALLDRVELFNNCRDNRGAFVLDKDSEEFFQFNTPLSGLNDLQAQAQEQMASVSSIPLVFLLGTTPQGLNASSEGEILVFETFIHSMQERLFNDPLKTVLEVIQLSEFGEIDPDITFEWVPLREITAVEKAQVRKTDAEADVALVSGGIISPDESRSRLASDPENPYYGLEENPDLTDPDGSLADREDDIAASAKVADK